MSVLAALLAVAVAMLLARPLNVLAAGELRARSVGLELEVWRTLCSSRAPCSLRSRW